MLYIKQQRTANSMFSVVQTAIGLTRGDTAFLDVAITNQVDGTSYEMASGDRLVLTIRTARKGTSGSETLLTKTLTGASTFEFFPADTEEMQYGSYVYDIQLTTASNEVFTVIPESPFEVLSEVT